MVRLTGVAPDRWAVKGGLALETRLGDRARVSLDLNADHLEGGEAARADLQRAATEDVGDHFAFALVGSENLRDAGAGLAIRYALESSLAGRPAIRASPSGRYDCPTCRVGCPTGTAAGPAHRPRARPDRPAVGPAGATSCGEVARFHSNVQRRCNNESQRPRGPAARSAARARRCRQATKRHQAGLQSPGHAPRAAPASASSSGAGCGVSQSGRARWCCHYTGRGPPAIGGLAGPFAGRDSRSCRRRQPAWTAKLIADPTRPPTSVRPTDEVASHRSVDHLAPVPDRSMMYFVHQM